MQLVLSWDLEPAGVNREPAWSDVNALLDRAEVGEGCVELQLGSRLKHVQLRADNRNYVLTMLDETDDVRSLVDPIGWDDEQILILGDYWGSAHVTRDFGVIRKAFREFFDSGDVSHAILD